MKIYLAGAIEKSPDHGKSIRKRVARAFRPSTIKFVNPCDFDYNQDQYPSMWKFQKDKNHSFFDCLKYSKIIADGDINTIVNCDAMIAILCENCGPGTGSEMTLCQYLGIPVFAIFKNPTKWRKVHPWIISRANYYSFNFEDLRRRVVTHFKECSIQQESLFVLSFEILHAILLLPLFLLRKISWDGRLFCPIRKLLKKTKKTLGLGTN